MKQLIEKTFRVENHHSAKEMGSGDLDVLSTPSLIAFMENVAKEQTAEHLEAGETTVGIELNVEHLKATAIGSSIQVRGELIKQKKAILSYTIEAYEEGELIGKGTHKRAIVQAEKFMKRLKKRGRNEK